MSIPWTVEDSKMATIAELQDRQRAVMAELLHLPYGWDSTDLKPRLYQPEPWTTQEILEREG